VAIYRSPVCTQTLKRGAGAADEPDQVPRASVLRRLAGFALATLAVTPVAAVLAAPAAAQDPAPPASVALTAPAAGATIGAGVATALTAAASGDVKVVSVHLDGGAPVCVFLRPRDTYPCPWTPQASDIGPHTVDVRVETTDGQVAMASTPLTVGRSMPAAIAARTERRHLKGRGWRLRTSGNVAVPAGLTPAACSGVATVTVLARGRTVVDRSVAVAADCRFSSAVSFSAPRGARSLRVKVAFGGDPLLAPRSAPVQTIRLR
jgi:alpha-beta hydrolase superfamily lysophospholipase